MRAADDDSANAVVIARFRKRLRNLAILVEAEPSPAQLARGGVPRGGTLLGLYEGRPLPTRSVFEPFAMPDRITIFQGHYSADYGPMMAAAVLAAIPILLVFLIFQKQIIKGISLTGLAGR